MDNSYDNELMDSHAMKLAEIEALREELALERSRRTSLDEQLDIAISSILKLKQDNEAMKQQIASWIEQIIK